MQDPRIIHWHQGDQEQNFGDFLTELMMQELFLFPRVEGDLYRIVGSCIAEWMIWDDLIKIGRQDSGRMVYWGCGLRDETPIHPAVVARSRFHGVRGPLSRDVLGLPKNTPLMDPGLLAPLIHPARPSPDTAGKILCMPHIADPKSDVELLRLSGASGVIRPTVSNDIEQLRKLLDVIASAGFLLTGSLHGAIFACAYKVPFAFWDNGHLDISFKWRDFAGSVGIPSVFVQTVDDGRKAYDQLIAPVLQRPATFPMLAESPIEVRPSVLLRSLIMDGLAPPQGLNAVIKRLSSSKVERQSVRNALVRDNVAFRRQVDDERHSQLRSMTDEVVKLTSAVSLLETEHKEAVALAAHLSAEKIDLHRQGTELRSAIDGTTQSNVELKAVLAQERASFEAERSGLRDAASAAVAENASLSARLAAADRSIEIGQDRLASVQSMSDALAAENLALVHQVGELSGAIAAGQEVQETLRRQESDLQEALADIKVQSDRLRVENQALLDAATMARTDIAALSGELDLARLQEDELKTARARQAHEAETARALLEQSNAALRAKIELDASQERELKARLEEQARESEIARATWENANTVLSTKISLAEIRERELKTALTRQARKAETAQAMLDGSIQALRSELSQVDTAIRSAAWPIALPLDQGPLVDLIGLLALRLNGHLKLQADARQAEQAHALEQARMVSASQSERQGLISKIVKLEDAVLLAANKLNAAVLENGRLVGELDARRQVAVN